MQKDITPMQHDGPMRIFVGGLTEQLDDVSDNDLRQLFPFGDIDFIDLDKDEITGKCRGYAYIQFRRASDARQAIKEMNGFNYNGKILKVEINFHIGWRSYIRRYK
jgi:RNA-binding protein 39